MKRFLTSTFLLALPFTASAQTAISQLPAASTPLTGTELLPLVQSGVTKSVTATNLRGAFYPGLVCDGATNITSPVQSAVTAAQSAGGGTIWLPAGNCIMGAITATASGIHIRGQGTSATTVTPVSGTYNLFTFTGSSSTQDGSVEDMTINAANLTGYDIAINGYNRMTVHNVVGQNTYNFLTNQSTNAMNVDNVNVFGVRGSYCFYLQAPGSTRSDVMDFTNIACGGATGSTYKGLVVDGFVNTVNLHSFAVSQPDGGGLVYQNTVGATSAANFFFGHDFQVEGSTSDGIHLGPVVSFYCANCYSSSNTGDGVYVSSSASDVNFTNPMIELNHKYGVETYSFAGGTGSTGTSITGGNVSANSNGSTGTYSNVLVGSTANNVQVTGVDLTGSTVNYGVVVQSGAQYVALTGNSYVGNATKGVNDLSGQAAIVGGTNNIGGPYAGSLIVDGGISGAREFGVANTGTTSGTQALWVAATGTASAYLIAGNQDGATPQGLISSGSGDTGGLNISTAAGPLSIIPATVLNLNSGGQINLNPGVSASIGKVVIATSGTTSASQTQIVVQTGTANAYLIALHQDGATPFGILGTGTADSGGLQIQTLAGPISLAPVSGQPVTISAPVSFKMASGTGTATFAAGAAAGTGPTVICSTSHVCDNFSGTVTLTTGTSPATGTLATITLPVTRTNVPNCSANIKGVSSAVYSDTETASTIVFSVTSALTASTAYTLNYVCGGV